MDIEIKGILDSELIYNEKSIKEKIYVLQKQTIGLISRKASIELGLIKLIGKVGSVFSKDSIPANVISDNGRQYTSKLFKEFSKEYKFT